jgi:hypothetical protein
MIYQTTEYYFSKRAFFAGTLLFAIVIPPFSFFVVKSYPANKGNAVLFAIPLLLILFALPSYIRQIYFLIINKPAIILTEQFLIDNQNMGKYKWSDIKEITYRFNTGTGRTQLGGYAAIILNDSDTTIQIQLGGIKCKRVEFMNTLIDYHKKWRDKQR